MNKLAQYCITLSIGIFGGFLVATLGLILFAEACQALEYLMGITQ